jgi:FkbM family methyltransferase
MLSIMKLKEIPWAVIARLRDIRRLGLFRSIKWWINGCSSRDFSVSVKDYKRPFHLRGETSDSWVFRALIVSDEYALIPESLKPETILDAGANAGFGIRWFKHRWPDAAVVAIEPDGDNFRMAQANSRELSDVTLIQGALCAEDGKASFVCSTDEKYALRVEMDEAGTIQCYSVSGIMQRMGWDRIDLLKMDIEGAEREVFGKGAEEWIGRIGVLVIELHEGVAPGCTVKLFEALQGKNFTLRWRGENLVVFFEPEKRVPEWPRT